MSPTKKYNWIILGVWALIFLPHLDTLKVNIMEARNFITAREMVSENNWLLTTLNAEPRYEKPPLPTWLTAISGMLFGFKNLFALRIPAALVTLLMLFFFNRLTLLLKITPKHSFLASLILATSFYIIFMGRHGQWDIFTHGFMLGGIYFLWLLFETSKNIWKNALFGAVFIGFSILSKGPVSLYALLLPFLIAYGSIYGFQGLKQKLKPLIFLIISSLVVGGWWFLYVRLTDPDPFLEITTREATRWTNYNVRPFYYYWSFFTQSGIWTIPAFIGLLYPYLRNRVANKKAYKFSIFWTLCAVILLSIIPEKKSRYLLPVLIPLALTSSFYVEYLFRKFKELPLKEKSIMYFNHGLIACLGLLFPVAGYFLLDLEGQWFWYIMTSIVLSGIGMGIIYFLKRQNYAPVFYLTVAFICGITLFAFPLANGFLKNPGFRSYADIKIEAEEQDLPVYLYKTGTPELIFDYGGIIPVVTEKDFQELKGGKFGILVREEDTSFIKDSLLKYEIISVARYDLNSTPPESSGYKDRLVRKYYLLQKK